MATTIDAAASPAELTSPRAGIVRRAWGAMRAGLFWAHLALGVVGGLCIGLMCVTGVLLAYERQVIQLIDGRPRVAPPTDSAVPLPLDQVLTAAAVPADSVATIIVTSDRSAPVQVRRTDRKVVLVDPYTAAVLPTPEAGKAQAFMSWLRGWHRWLGRQGEQRPPARLATGVSNAAFVLLALTGALLWIPRRLTLASLRRAVQWRTGLVPAARDWNWHTTGGFWFGAPLFVIALTGMFISFKWPGELLDRLVGSAAEQAAVRNPAPARTRADEPPGAIESSPRPVDAATRWMAAATSAVPEWTQLTLSMPDAEASTLRVVVAAGSTYRPDRRTTLTLDAATGAVQEAQRYEMLSLSRRLRGWVRFGHTGEAFGVVGQTVALVASAVGAMLVWTGLALSWRRWRRWRRRSSATASA